jgi:hypothetical protein
MSTRLDVGKGVIGTIGRGKAKPTGKIDIAVMQSPSRHGEAGEIVENYGQVIADECHHLSAARSSRSLPPLDRCTRALRGRASGLWRPSSAEALPWATLVKERRQIRPQFTHPTARRQ